MLSLLIPLYYTATSVRSRKTAGETDVNNVPAEEMAIKKGNILDGNPLKVMDVNLAAGWEMADLRVRCTDETPGGRV